MKKKILNVFYGPEHHEHHEDTYKIEHKNTQQKPEEFAHHSHETAHKVEHSLHTHSKKIQKLWWDSTEHTKKTEEKLEKKAHKDIPGAKLEHHEWNKPPIIVKTPELRQLKEAINWKEWKEAQEALTEYKRWILKEHLDVNEIPWFKDYTKWLSAKNGWKTLTKEELAKAKKEYLDKLPNEKLDEIYQKRMWELVIDKDGKKIPSDKYKELQKEVPALVDLEKTDPNLAKDIIALYGQDDIKAASSYLEKLKKDGKLPKNLEEFENAMKEFKESIKEESIRNPEWFETKVQEMVHSGQLSKQAWEHILKSLTPSQAHNVKPVSLPENFDSLEWKEKTLALIKKFEWFSPNSFWDYKQYTRGYGTKAPWPHQKISESAASSELSEKIDKHYNLWKYLDQQTLKWMWDNQKAAMTSFIFNLWPLKLKAFKPMLEKYAQAEWSEKQQIAQQIADKMQNYCHAGWKVLQGLVARRKTEAELFLKDAQTNSNNTETKKA